MTTDPNIPETAIAYEEAQVRDILSRNGLEIDQPIHFGSWCGRKHFVSYQDIVVARKIRSKESVTL